MELFENACSIAVIIIATYHAVEAKRSRDILHQIREGINGRFSSRIELLETKDDIRYLGDIETQTIDVSLAEDDSDENLILLNSYLASEEYYRNVMDNNFS